MKLLRSFLITILLFITLISNTTTTTIYAKKTTYYSKLTSSQKNMYKKIRKTLDKTSKINNIKVTLNGNYKDMLRSVEALSADCPYYFSGELEIEFFYDKHETEVTINSINSKKTIKNIKKNINKADLGGEDELATILNIHNYLIDHVEYDFSNSPDNKKFSIVGAVINGKAVCEGYARTFKYLCDLYDIPCILATGYTEDEFSNQKIRHMWNYVRLDNEWYAVDVTWDDDINNPDPESKYSYFLIGENSIGNDGKRFRDSHKRDKIFFNFDIKNEKDIKGFSYPNISKDSYFNEQNPYSYLVENGYISEETYDLNQASDNDLKADFIH